jgi:hypothetical protein
MRAVLCLLLLLLFCSVTAEGAGGLSVTSYRTAASTNAFAPLSRDQYFSEQLNHLARTRAERKSLFDNEKRDSLS